MQSHFDYLTALLIGGGVLLALAFTFATGQKSAGDATRFAAARSSLTAIVDVFGQDLSNVGAGVTTGHRLDVPVGTAPTTQFEFSGTVGPTETAVVERVRYQTVRRGTVAVVVAGARQTVPAYEVQRLILNPATGLYSPSGASVPTVTEFSVSLRDAAGATVTDAALARQVAVRIAIASPLGQGAGPSVVRWQRAFQITPAP